MNELKYKFERVTPTTLHVHGEVTTARFYASTAEDFDARIANLVEVFLLEVYRCKLCQFTSSLKTKICLHVSDVHQLDQTPLMTESAEHGENDSYGIGDEMTQENKENEDNLEKMPFFYGILNTMSPASCDMSLGDQSGNTNLVGASEANSLFEGEQSEFPLDESMPSDSIPPSSSANSPRSKGDDDAQCEHLLSLGLYRISSLRPLSLSTTKAEVSKSNSIMESARTRSRSRRLTNLPSLSVDDIETYEDKKKSYKCSSCPLDFDTKDTYKVHAQCHKHGGGFTCLYCGAFMNEWDPMEKHIKSHRLVRKSYQCQRCAKRFMTQSAWKSHMRGHDRKSQVFLCTKCPLSFDSESVRNLHVTCHSEDVFKCRQCGLTEQEWSKLHEHMCSHDSSLKTVICSASSRRLFTKTQAEANSFKHRKHKLLVCPSCSLTFKSIQQVNRHQKRVHRKQKKDCKKRKEKAGTQHKVLDPESSVNPQHIPKKEFTCDICNRKCSSKLALQRHMGVHAGEKPFHCSHCDYKTRLKASLTQHIRVHTGEKPFRCKLCSYASIDASSLRRHIRTHTSEKPYKCERCSYSCIQKKSLDLHIRRHHTGEMFKCSLCQYSSPDKQLLHKHNKKHHADEEAQLSSQPLPTS